MLLKFGLVGMDNNLNKPTDKELRTGYTYGSWNDLASVWVWICLGFLARTVMSWIVCVLSSMHLALMSHDSWDHDNLDNEVCSYCSYQVSSSDLSSQCNVIIWTVVDGLWRPKNPFYASKRESKQLNIRRGLGAIWMWSRNISIDICNTLLSSFCFLSTRWSANYL